MEMESFINRIYLEKNMIVGFEVKIEEVIQLRLVINF